MDTSTNPQAHSPFFRMPIEIRCSIYEIILEDQVPLPINPKDAEQVTRYEHRPKHPGPPIRYPTYYESPYLRLRLTCRKISAEVRQLQNSDKSHAPRICKLDLIIMPACAIPTWLVPPAQVKGIEYDLEVSLRLFDVRDTITIFGSDGRTGTISSPLKSILIHLIHYGPQFLPSAQLPAPEPLRLNTITISLTYPSSEGDGPCEIYYGRERGRLGGPRNVPGRALNTVLGFMYSLIRSGLPWGKIREIRIYSLHMGMGRSLKVTNNPNNPAQTVLEDWTVYGYTWSKDNKTLWEKFLSRTNLGCPIEMALVAKCPKVISPG